MSIPISSDAVATIALSPAFANDRFIRGDANNDNVVGIADAATLFMYLFDNGSTPDCLDAADANDDGSLDVSDVFQILCIAWPTVVCPTGPPPAAPWPNCGHDPTTGDLLDCVDHLCGP